MSLTKTTYAMIEGAFLNVLDFGAVGDGVADDTVAIQNTITAALAQKKAVFIPSGVYKYTASNFNINTQAAGTNLLIFGEGGGGGFGASSTTKIQIDANNVIFNVRSIHMLPLVCKDISFEVINTGTNNNATIFYFTTTFGSGWSFENCTFLNFTNCAIHGIRSYNSGAKNCEFIGTSAYSDTSGLLALDDACVRLWGADGTLTLQDHSFSNLITFERCNFAQARYGVDAWGLATSTFTSCTFNYTWIGFINRPAPTLTGGNISNTFKSGFNVASTALIACWYEQNAKWHYSNVDVDPATGNDQNITYTAQLALSQNVDRYDTIQKNRHQGVLDSSRFRSFVLKDGTNIDPNWPWWVAFTNNEAVGDVTYYNFRAGSAFMKPKLYAQGGFQTFSAAWNGSESDSPIIMGDYRLWVDATGDLRIKNGQPTSDTDGTVVGNQT